MLYQKAFTCATPYHMRIARLTPFELSKHLEYELLYCYKGSSIIKVDTIEYKLDEGDCAFIQSMHSHEVPKNQLDNLTAIIMLGPAFLQHSFSQFSNLKLDTPILKKQDIPLQLQNLFQELFLLNQQNSTNDLIIKGILFQIFGYLLSKFGDLKPKEKIALKPSYAYIEDAMQLIHDRYAEPISVELAAKTTGYEKSNFCKIFKNTFGESFHKILNRHRIEIACYLLSETSSSIEDIATKTGFLDSKTFCRVFKSITGITPTTFRKSSNFSN